jgi:hypothetical protein
MTHLVACPFCGSDKLIAIQADENAWFVECASCRCTGPVDRTEYQAASAWANRAELPSPEDGEHRPIRSREPQPVH